MGKHFLIYGHGGAYNHGSEAIIRCTVAFLRERFPNCFITLSTHFPEQDKEFMLDVDEIVTRNTEGKNSDEVYKDALDRITPETIVIHAAGDNYCYVNWQRYARINEVAKERGCKTVLWDFSIDEDKIDDEMLMALKNHDIICARECITYDTLVKKGLENVIQMSDVAFSLEPERVELDLQNYVVINLSPLVCRKNPATKDAVQRLIGFIISETEYNIALVPHVVVSVDNDYEILSELAQNGSARVVLVSDKLSARQYKYIISKAELCVAARTHVTIASYSSCVPTLSIGYSVKAYGIAKDLGFTEYVVDIMDETIGETLLARYEKLMEEKKELRQKLVSQMSDYKKKALPEGVITFLERE